MATQQDTSRQQAQQIRRKLTDLAGSLESEIGKVDDPKAQVLFETSREVLKGLATAFDHYEHRSEQAWR
jgi:hypothetical protein